MVPNSRAVGDNKSPGRGADSSGQVPHDWEYSYRKGCSQHKVTCHVEDRTIYTYKVSSQVEYGALLTTSLQLPQWAGPTTTLFCFSCLDWDLQRKETYHRRAVRRRST